MSEAIDPDTVVAMNAAITMKGGVKNNTPTLYVKDAARVASRLRAEAVDRATADHADALAIKSEMLHMANEENVELRAELEALREAARRADEILSQALNVVSYVSMGRGYVGVKPYPDALARVVNAQIREVLAQREAPAEPEAERLARCPLVVGVSCMESACEIRCQFESPGAAPEQPDTPQPADGER